MIKKMISKVSKKSSAKAATKKTVAKKTATKKAVSKRKTTKSVLAGLSPEELYGLISIKAYELYESRGYSHGHDLGDWYEAERIILSNFK